ncbi:MAG: hypothetical protein JEY96_16875 [Bacteroidales bacterium]|nr:hypothetical protein [Bacteroidales bacterium]
MSITISEKDFCKAYTEIYGEPLDNLEQLTKQTFTGQELFEFVNDIIKLQHDPTVCPNCGKKHPLVAEFGYCGSCAEKIYK